MSDGVPTKKNRLGDEEDNHSLTNQDSQAERVGHIRQRVQDLTWQEQKEREKELEKTQGKAILGSEPNNTASSSTSEILESPTKKQKQPTFASFSSSSSSPFASTKAPTSNIFASSTSDSSSTSISNHNSTAATNTSMKDVFAPKSLTAQPSSPSSKSSNTSMEDATPIPAPAKLSNTSTQPTFSSFSSTSSSPFNSKSPVAGPSWLGSNSNSKPTSAFGGIKPSSLGSSISTSNADQSKSSSSIFASNPTSSSSPATNSKSKAKASPALGFGAFAGSSPFASAKSSTGLSSPNQSGSSSPALQSGDPSEEKRSQVADEGLNKSETEDAFSQVLSQKDDSGNQIETAFGEEAASQGDGNGLSGNKGKGKETAMTDRECLVSFAWLLLMSLWITEQNFIKAIPNTDLEFHLLCSLDSTVTTGEESERTVHSARAKLYVMSSDANNTWKERGVGTIRCNVPKISMLDRSSGSKGDQKKGARLGEYEKATDERRASESVLLPCYADSFFHFHFFYPIMLPLSSSHDFFQPLSDAS